MVYPYRIRSAANRRSRSATTLLLLDGEEDRGASDGGGVTGSSGSECILRLIRVVVEAEAMQPVVDSQHSSHDRVRQCGGFNAIAAINRTELIVDNSLAAVIECRVD